MTTLKLKKNFLFHNCTILKTGKRWKFEFGKKVFLAYPKILVNKEKLDLNPPLKKYDAT